MKSTIEIIIETTKLFNRFCGELPHNYMQEVFGKDDPKLAELCLQMPKHGVSAMYQLMIMLKSDEQRALASYINKKNK